jgi:hypothetical protein
LTIIFQVVESVGRSEPSKVSRNLRPLSGWTEGKLKILILESRFQGNHHRGLKNLDPFVPFSFVQSQGTYNPRLWSSSCLINSRSLSFDLLPPSLSLYLVAKTFGKDALFNHCWCCAVFSGRKSFLESDCCQRKRFL